MGPYPNTREPKRWWQGWPRALASQSDNGVTSSGPLDTGGQRGCEKEEAAEGGVGTPRPSLRSSTRDSSAFWPRWNGHWVRVTS